MTTDRDILPDTFKVVHYDLSITDLDFTTWSYKGAVKIQGRLTKPTNEIIINTLKLELHSATLSAGSQVATSSSFSDDVRAQRTTISFEDTVPAAHEAALTVNFTGEINHDMAGFYRSQYKPEAPPAASVPRDADFCYMMSTQFEACDARRAFPCFDEPNLKATFDFQIEVPEDLVALGNMPVKSTDAGRAGYKLVSFERTPVMSTYLLAWAVGDFEYIEAFTDREYNGEKVPVRVYTTGGLKEQGRWALWHAPRVVDFFSEKFGIDYPLPKADILAVPNFAAGAMENFGLVTYRLTAILFDEERSEARYRDRISYVVSHELAHHWFGNLVTMQWWDELWLNEGFATWAGYLATHHLHPDWDVWAQVVHETMEAAFNLDAVRSSHAIHVPVRDGLEVNQVFDAISYRKGCSIIRMLADHLGTDVFLKGVSTYLKRHQYGNATTADLWGALSETSGVDVNSFMSNWTTATGFPVLTIAEEPSQINIRQNRFLSTGDVKPEEDTTVWWTPLGVKGKIDTKDAAALALTTREYTLRGVDDEFFLVNAEASGFYRVNYPPARLAKLGTQLSRLSSLDKIFIIGSAADMAASGYGKTAALLSFLQGLSGETNYRVLSRALDAIGTVRSVFGDDEALDASLRAFNRRMMGKALVELGWESQPGEDFNRDLLRQRLILASVVSGHPGVNEEAVRRFQAFKADRAANPIPPHLRAAVYRAALKADPVGATAFIKGLWATTAASAGRDTYLAALGHVPDQSVIESTILPLLFNISPPASASDSVPLGDMHTLSSALAGNRKGRHLQWAWMKKNWADIVRKTGGNPVVVERLVRMALSKFTDNETLADIESFFAGQDTRSFDRTLETVKDMIRGRAAYRERDASVLKEWLVANGY